MKNVHMKKAYKNLNFQIFHQVVQTAPVSYEDLSFLDV